MFWAHETLRSASEDKIILLFCVYTTVIAFHIGRAWASMLYARMSLEESRIRILY